MVVGISEAPLRREELAIGIVAVIVSELALMPWKPLRYSLAFRQISFLLGIVFTLPISQAIQLTSHPILLQET